MQRPNLNDCIVAVSSAWAPSPTGIIRLCGRESVRIVDNLVVAPGTLNSTAMESPRVVRAQLRVFETEHVPADIYLFPAKQSYSGTETVEIHTIGSLPVLRAITQALIDNGARPALGGEFTSRAFLNGRLSATQVGAVLALIHADNDGVARQSARTLGKREEVTDDIADRLANTLALIEAGIDFVDEEGISFISSAEVRRKITTLRDEIQRTIQNTRLLMTDGLPHVVLAGLPNAGKSTLFNTLVGSERAIVSPIIGTTRDVVSAPVRLGSTEFVLQDTAGLVRTDAALEVAAYELTHATSGYADLVIWVHARNESWADVERVALDKLDRERVLLVINKCDEGNAEDEVSRQSAPSGFSNPLHVSAATQDGLDLLRSGIAAHLSEQKAESGAPRGRAYGIILETLDRIIEMCGTNDVRLADPELVAEDLRFAIQTLADSQRLTDPDALLGRIFTQFCIGK